MKKIFTGETVRIALLGIFIFSIMAKRLLERDGMKAISLVSGGLDGILAARMIQEQGIEVIPVCFKLPVFHRERKGTVDKFSLVRGALGKELEVIDISADFLELIVNPKHGFGSNMNPCIDCKILMLRSAKSLMEKRGASFIVTGEVVGQRPMSQTRRSLECIDKSSGLEGLILRPLSAKLLLLSLPEREGWVDRAKLFSFNGRNRSPQIELAFQFGIKDYPNPAGGCLLTDPQFSRRLKDIMDHQELNLDNIELLKFGRHFRVSSSAKLIVGRDEEENECLAGLSRENDYLFFPPLDLAGPTALGRGVFNEQLIKLSLGITCAYCDLNAKSVSKMIYRVMPGKEEYVFEVLPLSKEQIKGMLV